MKFYSWVRKIDTSNDNKVQYSYFLMHLGQIHAIVEFIINIKVLHHFIVYVFEISKTTSL